MKLPRGLIVSCQAAEGEPLFGLDLMRYMARSAKEGGAVAIRALGEEIESIKREVGLPVIGLIKRVYAGSDVYITPTRTEIDRLLAIGCEVIAMDATLRPRPDGASLRELYAYTRSVAPHVELMADCDGLQSALAADAMGFDYVGTTLCGYTAESRCVAIPDYALLATLRDKLTHAKLIAEGGIWEIGQLAKVAACDPYATVIGSAITRPKDITARFAQTWRNACL